MTPAEELASAYDEVVDLTGTADMSDALQPQFIARMLGVPPTDVVALHSLRKRIRARPDDPDLRSEAEQAVGAVGPLLEIAVAYAARGAEQPAARGGGAPVAGSAGAADTADIECMAFADAVDWLLETMGVADLPAGSRVEALARALRIPRQRISTVTDVYAAVTGAGADPGTLVAHVRAARPVLDRLVDRAEHGDLVAAPPLVESHDGDRRPPDDEGIDELSRLARQRLRMPSGGVWPRRLLVGFVLIALVGLIVALVVV